MNVLTCAATANAARKAIMAADRDETADKVDGALLRGWENAIRLLAGTPATTVAELLEKIRQLRAEQVAEGDELTVSVVIDALIRSIAEDAERILDKKKGPV